MTAIWTRSAYLNEIADRYPFAVRVESCWQDGPTKWWPHLFTDLGTFLFREDHYRLCDQLFGRPHIDVASCFEGRDVVNMSAVWALDEKSTYRFKNEDHLALFALAIGPDLIG